MTIADFRLGDPLKDITLPPVSKLDLIKYAGASGDYNPIHTIDEEAEKAGLPGIIAHGMWTMGSLSKLFSPFYEEGFIEAYTIRFKGMVFLGDVLTHQADLYEMNDESAKFHVRAVNQDGTEVAKGDVVFRRI
ncbi:MULTISPECIES: MaoC/PaaZ C-terminal domain-containing protein [Metabacillus]|uniref:MaoC/PaaZ C-terminal domain-containing protein n=1 Tax=Metabacillus hrfriensis TaxID=3048891 RepID=A0ACD4R5M3_9BACI|nr:MULTISPECIES: MaoC/PaaZ C-terminal domain-containing protein [Metabacillus]UAL50280.1 dehydratase [Metabacillus dongyingensis]USK26529.1 dehydratase [Bacillus sp. CMF21]WHZ55753.1 MaoC/PaaZ C-terminal domain-containing protein [Metabacillus sp. CT-WN-B3]